MEMTAQERYRAYNGFAQFYDLYWGAHFLEQAAPGIERLLLPLLPQGARVLDLCCGTGRLARWLARRGFDVTGIDGSEEMLELARRNAPEAAFVLADARSFAFGTPFDVVISTFDSLNHLPAVEDLTRVFRNVREALGPGGLFFFDMNMHEGFEAGAGENFADVHPDRVCAVRSEYDSASGVGRSLVTLFTPCDGLWKRADLEITEYCYSGREIERALQQTGFAPPKVFDAHEAIGMPNGEGRLFYLAHPA
jgi:SAM-dependent methyltransferase